MSVRLLEDNSKYYYKLKGEVLVVEEYKNSELQSSILSSKEFDSKYRDYAIKAIVDFDSRLKRSIENSYIREFVSSIKTGLIIKSSKIYSVYTAICNKELDDELLNELKVFLEDEASLGAGSDLFNNPIYEDNSKEVFMYLWNSNNFELEYI